MWPPKWSRPTGWEPLLPADWIPPEWLTQVLLPSFHFPIFSRGLFLDSWRAPSVLGLLCLSVKKIRCSVKKDMSVELPLILVFPVSHGDLCFDFTGTNHQDHHTWPLLRGWTNQFAGLLPCFSPPPLTESPLRSSLFPHLTSYRPSNSRRKL